MSHLRTMSDADRPAVDVVLRSAYNYPGSYLARIDRYRSVEPEGWIVATDGRAICGAGGFLAFGKCAYIGLMGVVTGVQRRGVGAAILGELIRRAEARGCTLSLLDASESGAPLYLRNGFVPHGEAVRYRYGGADANSKPTRAHVRSVDPGDTRTLEEIATFDAGHYGADRRALVRQYITEAKERAFVALEKGRVVGYVVAQRVAIGPCMAHSSEVAEELLRAVLPLPFDVAPMVIAASQNAAAEALLTSVGFQRERSLVHMRRGDGAALGSDWSRLYAKGSHGAG